ncbi:hypothetical protein VTL71DRAFT_3459 [Oculimacula yallundae]|uniref:Uncharacterized protein n=1 Tax=Oculimacula yallundae TaxID=86028 RepID=A0ABR4C7B4_9HELO
MEGSKEFVRRPMSEMVFGAVMSGGGNSGDLIRVVAAAVEVYLSRNGLNFIDKVKTEFWKSEVENVDDFDSNIHSERRHEEVLGTEAIVALTKVFALGWLQEILYQVYHDLPIELFLGH